MLDYLLEQNLSETTNRNGNCHVHGLQMDTPIFTLYVIKDIATGIVYLSVSIFDTVCRYLLCSFLCTACNPGLKKAPLWLKYQNSPKVVFQYTVYTRTIIHRTKTCKVLASQFCVHCVSHCHIITQPPFCFCLYKKLV